MAVIQQNGTVLVQERVFRSTSDDGAGVMVAGPGDELTAGEAEALGILPLGGELAPGVWAERVQPLRLPLADEGAVVALVEGDEYLGLGAGRVLDLVAASVAPDAEQARPTNGRGRRRS